MLIIIFMPSVTFKLYLDFILTCLCILSYTLRLENKSKLYRIVCCIDFRETGETRRVLQIQPF